MIHLNEVNGADLIEELFTKKVYREFDEDLVGVVMGVAYGGSLEMMGKIWGDKGNIYGYDTFEDLHPGFLVESNGNGDGFERTCMQHWYDSKDYGTEKLSMEYQRNQLDEQGLSNVHLIKGLVTEDSCKDLVHINYAFLDMDILESMKAGFEAVIDKMDIGGYLLMHDMTGNIPRLNKWYEEELINDARIEKVYIDNNELIVVFKIVYKRYETN